MSAAASLQSALGAPMHWRSWLSFVLGLLVLLLTANSVMRVLIIARPAKTRMSAAATRVFAGPMRAITRHIGSYEVRDRILSPLAALQIVSMAAGWLLLFVLGYGLLLNAGDDAGLAWSLREAGSSLFTLGFAAPDRAQLTLIDFAAAATGPMLIGLLIGYLPTMYAAYNRRGCPGSRGTWGGGPPLETRLLVGLG